MKKKNEKLNPIMTDVKNVKKNKNVKIDDSEESNEIKKFIIIVVVLIVIIAAIYIVTELITKEDTSTDSTSEVTAGSISYDKTSVGTILNRPYDEYYVMVYNADDAEAILYSTILTSYMGNSDDEDYIKIYFCDLNNSLNSKYYDVDGDGVSNPDATSISELDFGDLTLLKIKNGKIVKYIEDYETIKELLS